jgi:hypothetical protein
MGSTMEEYVAINGFISSLRDIHFTTKKAQLYKCKAEMIRPLLLSTHQFENTCA